MRYLFLFLLLVFLIFQATTATAQYVQSFETQATSQTASVTSSQYIDPFSAAAAHELLKDTGGGRCIPVSSVTAGTNLGFRSFFRPSMTGASNVGLTDGDFFGYAGNVVISGNVGQNATDGNNAFIVEDTDGEVTLLFDPVTLPVGTSGTFSMDWIVDGSFEAQDGANDRIYIELDVTGCGAAAMVVLLDTDGDGRQGGDNATGIDLDNAMFNGQPIVDKTWYTVNQDLSAYGGCNVQLRVEMESNSSTEEMAIDNIVFTAGAVLPVELTNFTALPGRKEIDLRWITASEDGNRGFSVERSMDGIGFTTIGWVDGVGSTEQVSEYHFVDEQVTAGQSYYYRLRQEDHGGAFAYSGIEIARLSGTQQTGTLNAYPNPTVGGFTTLEISTEQDSERAIAIFDIGGRRVAHQLYNLTKGTNRIELDLTLLKPGTYLVRVTGEDGIASTRIVR